MIVRSTFECLTCDQAHTVRIGIGQEAFQTHRFPCLNCGEDLVVGLRVNYKEITAIPEAVENCKHVPAVVDAPIVNVDANFIIPQSERHKDRAFPRIQQQLDSLEAAAKARAITVGELLANVPNYPARRPDYSEEWRLLRKAWSLHRRGQEKLCHKRVAEASEKRYADDPLQNLADWLFRFAFGLGGPAYENKFIAAIDAIRPLLELPSFSDFMRDYEQLASGRGARFLDLMREYFSAFSEFSRCIFELQRA